MKKLLEKLKEKEVVQKHYRKIIIAIIVIVVAGVSVAGLTIQKSAGYYETGNKDTKAELKADDKKNEKDSKDGSKENKSDQKTSKDQQKDAANKKSAGSKNGSSTGSSPKASSSGSKSSTASKSSSNVISVYVTIDFSKIKPGSKGYSKLPSNLKNIVPSSGYLISNTRVDLEKGSTAWDALNKISRTKRILVSHIGSGSNLYVNGINNIFEKDAGAGSGWLYSVNGSYPNYGMGSYTLSNGSYVNLVYTTNLGCDVYAGVTGC